MTEAVIRYGLLEEYAESMTRFLESEGKALGDIARRYQALIRGDDVSFVQRDVELLNEHAKVMLRRAGDLRDSEHQRIRSAVQEDERVGGALAQIRDDIRAVLGAAG
ncbi:MAG TPA: hypothetical protein VF092_25830 [Longimicrobium sp.]